MFTAEQEVLIERLRQQLCAMREFEPFTAFRRIDRQCLGLLDSRQLCQFVRENGFRELEPSDFATMIAYFDLDGDKKLNYHDFLQVLLSCDDGFLRAAATQRPSHDVAGCQFLPCSVEKLLS